MPLITKWSDVLIDTEDEQLRQRIATGNPKQTIRGMFFNAAIAALKESAGLSETSRVLKKIGMENGRWTVMGNYPVSDFNKLRLAICEKLANGNPEGYADAAMLIARNSSETFFKTLPGRTMKIISSRNPHRMAEAGPRGYKAIINDGGTRSYENLGPRSGVFVFENDTIGPAHQVGVFLTTMKNICKVDVQIRVRQSSLGNFKLYLDW